MDQSGAPSLKRDRSLEGEEAASSLPNKQPRPEGDNNPPLFLRKVDGTVLSYAFAVSYEYLGSRPHNFLSYGGGWLDGAW